MDKQTLFPAGKQKLQILNQSIRFRTTVPGAGFPIRVQFITMKTLLLRGQKKVQHYLPATRN